MGIPDQVQSPEHEAKDTAQRSSLPSWAEYGPGASGDLGTLLGLLDHKQAQYIELAGEAALLEEDLHHFQVHVKETIRNFMEAKDLSQLIILGHGQAWYCTCSPLDLHHPSVKTFSMVFTEVVHADQIVEVPF